MERLAWLITALLQSLIEWNVSACKSSSLSVKTHPEANDDGTHNTSVQQVQTWASPLSGECFPT